MTTFDQYLTESLSATPRHVNPSSIPTPVLDNLKQAGLIPMSLSGAPTMAEAASLLLAKVIEMHAQQVSDPTATRREKRLTYQIMNNSFLTVLALAGSFPEPQEHQ